MLFFAYLGISRKRNIKRSPSGMKPSEKLFLERKHYGRLGVHVRKETREPRGRGRALHPRGPLVAPLTYFFLLYIPIYPKNFEEHNSSGVPPPEASVATENQSRPVMNLCIGVGTRFCRDSPVETLGHSTGGKRAFGRGSQLPLVAVAQPRPNGRD